MSYYELNHADLDRWITRTPEDDYDPHDELRAIEAEAREQGESDYLAECWEKGVCPSCGGDGRFYNMFGTGDQAGGAADTCDDCNGSGKSAHTPTAPACPVCDDGSCPWCARGIVYDGPCDCRACSCAACGQSGHAITACPAIRAAYDQAEPPSDARQIATLRGQLANLHEAVGCARALLSQGEWSAAALVLDDAMKGKR